MQKSPQSALASHLIKEIRHRLPENMELAKNLEPLLEVGRSALYKRLRGALAFTPDELVVLARHFQISMDKFVLDQPGIVALEFPVLTEPVHSSAAFLSRVEQQLQVALNLPEPTLFYASAEIPLFCYFRYPELTAFKLYMWSRTTWLLPEFEHQKFSFSNFPNKTEILKRSEAILRHYCDLPSCEFWTLHMLENTLNQIDFLAYEGGFAEPEMAKLLHEQLGSLISWQQQMAERGCKIDNTNREGAKLLVYHNEIAHTNNTLLVQSATHRQAFFTFDNPNFGTSSSPVFCNYTADWFNRLQRCSIRMSREGEKQRFRFFEKLQHRLFLKSKEPFF
ncbi:MAG: hypothetical protein H6574_13720 [Lewinellaceae bacterium]|nr:hypothetical protein [Saprospiraceae bacterium]MCB9332136.1 hypothetical protein [Lewinellaceae bacterium]